MGAVFGGGEETDEQPSTTSSMIPLAKGVVSEGGQDVAIFCNAVAIAALRYPDKFLFEGLEPRNFRADLRKL